MAEGGDGDRPDTPEWAPVERGPSGGWSKGEIERVAGSATLEGNLLELRPHGPDAFDSWASAIARAERFIYVENYCIRGDATGRRLRELLCEKAKQGVSVFIVHDWLGCWATPGRFWRPLAEAGVRVHCFNPPRPTLGNPLVVFQRDHRKLIVVDGRAGSVGGFCIGDEWIAGKKGPPWRDTGVDMRGPLVGAAQSAFESIWRAATGERLESGEVRPGTSSGGNAHLPEPHESADLVPAWLIEGEPGRARVYRALHLAALRAREHIWITDAYFVAPKSILEALGAAAGQGVDVRILVPANNNWPIVGSLSRGGYRNLLESGIRIFEWQGPMIHAKTSVVDGIWGRVGSSNLNTASLLSNWELDVSFLDERLAGELNELFLEDLANSVEIVLPRRYLRPSAERSLEPPGTLRERLEEFDLDGRVRRGKSQRALASAVRAGTVLRGALAGNRTLGREDRTVLGVVSASVFALAIVAAIFPVLASWTFAVVAGWFGLTNAVRAFVQSRRARLHGRSDPGEAGSSGSAGT